MNSDASEAPHPDGGWSCEMRVEHEAVIMPPDRATFRQRAGILDNRGDYCAHGATWRFGRRMTMPPKIQPTPQQTLTGRWLWGGVLFDHFGHFLVESVSRLWGLDHAAGGVDGICYIPKRMNHSGQLRGFQKDFITAFGVDVPIEIIRKPALVETLIIPGQAFGLGEIICGTAEMRDVFRHRFAADIPADGPERLYVSRSALPVNMGAIIGEGELEKQLMLDGYEVFFPEKHPIATQIARYKAARQIIIADGSAGHLYAYVGRADQQAAYLPRRSFWTEGPIEHIGHFTGVTPLILNAIRREWLPLSPKAFRGVSYAQIKLRDIQQMLLEAGFIGQGAAWPELTNDTATAFMRLNGLAADFAVAPTEAGS